MVFEHKPVNVSNVVNSALRMLRPLANERNVTISMDIAPRSVIYATDDDLYQIIFNLTENAIKYNLQGGWVKIKSVVEDECVKISVSDTGIGVPDEDLPHIFDRFYRVDKARSREAGGSGLGLSIVRDTVAVHGGSIKAWRRNGGGMVFQVSFPYGCNVETIGSV
jgi:signal transduction histidine kinase